MNLHSIVAPMIGAVNPFINVVLQVSTGISTIGADGTPAPAYATPVTISAQIQPLSYKELERFDALNLNGDKRAIYANGNIDGIERVALKGGDLITFPDGTVWLVVINFEGWNLTAGWTKAGIVLQNGS